MGIDLYFLETLRQTRFPGPRVACLGYPDVVEDRRAIGGELLPASPYCAAIQKWHGLLASVEPPDTDALLARLGLTEPTYFDLMPSRSCEVAMNLNEPLPTEWRGRFDVLIDTGTLEHCFNIGQAFCNMADMLKEGGVVVAMWPMTNINHGFWCVQPTAAYDAFTQNGWVVEKLCARWKNGRQIQVMDFLPNPGARAKSTPNEGVLVVVARRVVVQPWVWPTQAKYLPKSNTVA